MGRRISFAWLIRNPLVFPLVSLGIVAAKVLWPVYLSSTSKLHLLWPGKQVISGVLYVRGDLQSDFLASSTVDSSYLISAKLISAILPHGREQMLAAYASFACLLSILVLWLSIIFLVKAWRILCRTNQLLSADALEAVAPLVYVGLAFVLPAIYHNEIHGLWSIIHPARVAGWDFPLADAFNPSGVSFLLTLVALLIKVSGPEHRGLRLNPGDLTRAVVPLILIFIATIVHPVVPLFGVVAFMFFSLIVGSPSFLNLRYVKEAGLFALAWLVGALMVFLLFPQVGIDANDYFRIYVVNRHPHHYLPSHYIRIARVDVAVNFVVLGVLAIASTRCTKSRWSLKAFALCFALLTAVHAAQYLFVEVSKSPVFITLGISRVSGFYNFAYLLLLVTGVSIVGCRVKALLFRRTEGSGSDPISALVPRSRAIGFIVPVVLTCAILVFSGVLLSKIFYNQFRLVTKQPEWIIRSKFDSLVAERDYEVLSDFKLSNLREVGGLAVYSDKYFPFASRNVLEWERRRVLNRTFLQCFKRKKSIDVCATRLAGHGRLYLLTKTKASGKKPVFRVKTGKGVVYAYQV